MDATALGFRAGLEIHQQIDSRKLFCACPSLIRDDQPDLVVERRLRASAGETGTVDVAARHEQKKQKSYRYQSYNDTTCLVELDEEPVHSLNADALQVVLQVALMTNARVVDRIAVMRKTVVDGSNTSGFQRTALVARNGSIHAGSGTVTIPTICIEEESAKIVERTPERDVYNLSRLGIPLIEIATGPDITSPEQLKETAEHIGMLLRSTGRVKRGLGTIRQDVNISIRNGSRVEIKGAQELKLLPKLASSEALRQQKLLQLQKELQQRNAAVGHVMDITALLKHSRSTLISTSIRNNGAIIALKLAGFAGLVGRELIPGRRLGKEFSEHARVTAGVGGAVHMDELPAYGITADETKSVAAHLGCEPADCFIFVADQKNKALNAVHAIAERAKQALRGVPSEVRKANPDGTTSFLRPMPGAARMYPETDAVFITPDISAVSLPELRSDRITRYAKLGLGKNLAATLVRDERDALFDAILAACKNVSPAFVAETLVSYRRDVLRLHSDSDPSRITGDHLRKLFTALDRGSIAKESVIPILADIATHGTLNLAAYRIMSTSALEAALKKIVAANKDLPLNTLIGKAMADLRGKADGRTIVQTLQKLAASPRKR